ARVPGEYLDGRPRPANAEGRVVPTHSRTEIRIIVVRHHVNDDAVVSQREETVGAAGRNVDRLRRISKLDRRVLQIRTGTGSQIERDIVDPAGDAADQFVLPGRRKLEMKAAKGPLPASHRQTR